MAKVKVLNAFVYCDGVELEGMTVFQGEDGDYTIHKGIKRTVKLIPGTDDIFEVIAA